MLDFYFYPHQVNLLCIKAEKLRIGQKIKRNYLMKIYGYDNFFYGIALIYAPVSVSSVGSFA